MKFAILASNETPKQDKIFVRSRIAIFLKSSQEPRRRYEVTLNQKSSENLRTNSF